jgi:ATP-dependent DNA helicase RecQ
VPVPRSAADSWEGVDRGLFECLRQLRTQFAAERSVPAYVIFSDAALRDMARRRPSTLEGFRHVKGVGEHKSADLGPAFVTTISEYCREHAVGQDITLPPPTAITEEPAGRLNTSSIAAFEFFRRGASVEEVMQKMNRARSTVFGYLCDYLRHERISDPAPWVDPATALRIEAAADAVGGRQLRPIFDHLGGEVPYESIRAALACRQNRLGVPPSV